MDFERTFCEHRHTLIFLILGAAVSCGTCTWSQAAFPGRGQGFALGEIYSRDVDAVRLCDGFEFRHHRGGSVTWFAWSSGQELPVTVPAGLPADHWWHMSGCSCEACRTAAAAPFTISAQDGR